jgi:hypothetical protein
LCQELGVALNLVTFVGAGTSENKKEGARAGGRAARLVLV